MTLFTRIFIVLFLSFTITATGWFDHLTIFQQKQSCCFAQEETTSDKSGNKRTALSTRAKKIFERAQLLTASVINVSKGAKGVGVPISDREKWEEIAQSSPFKGVIAEAEKLQKEPIPEPTEADYMRFYEEESKNYSEINRDYENKFNQRRHRLFHLVLAECFENKGRFLKDIEEIIVVICAEPNWTIPWEDGEAKKFKGESRSIDFQMARTAWDLATAHYWLGKKLSSQIRELIHDTVQMRIFSVFEEAVSTDNYNLINWANDAGHVNAMCHAAVVGAALGLIDAADRRSKYIAAAEINVEKFLQIFTRDGYFPDGVWAWNEGYGSFILLAELLYQSTNGRIDTFKRPNIKETALYGARMEITQGVYESIGDRWRGDRPQLFPTAFISKRFKMGLTEIENRSPFFGIGPGHLYMVGTYCFPNSASEEKGLASGTEMTPLETLRNEFALNGVMILRTGKKERDQLGVQLKGGNNDERGNHSDVGTYVVALGGGVPLCDIGARYNRRGLVVKDRMESNFINSFGHPVPRIDEKLQKNGKGTVCPLLLREYTDEKDTLKFDLQYVYEWNDQKDVKELTRTFVFDRTGKELEADGKAMLTVTDRYRGKRPVAFENCLITFGPFKKMTEDEESPILDLIVGEGNLALHITVSNEVTEIDPAVNKYRKYSKPFLFEAALLDEPIPRITKTPFRLGFGFETPVDEASITVKIRPATFSERDLAKKSPGEATRTYTSPIDAPPEEENSGNNPENQLALLEKKYGKMMDEMIKKLPVPLEELKKLSDEDLKAQFEQIRQTQPLLKAIPDSEIDGLIQLLRSKIQ